MFPNLGNIGNFMANMASSVTNANQSYLPANGDFVAIRNGSGGFLGGVRDREAGLMVVDVKKEWEIFQFETHGNKFALRQKISNNYVGGSGQTKQQSKLMQNRYEGELFSYNILPNGLLNIVNNDGNKLSRDARRAIYDNANTINETWAFELAEKAVSSSSSTSSTVHNPTSHTTSAGYGMPPAGAFFHLENLTGGNVGKVRGQNEKLEFVPHAQDWEVFSLEALPNNRYVIKQRASGLNIGQCGNAGQRIGLVPHVGECEEFMVDPINGAYALRNFKGNYLSKSGNNLVLSNANTNYELFRFVPAITSSMIQPANNTGSTFVGTRPLNAMTYSIRHNVSGRNLGGVGGDGEELRVVPHIKDCEIFTFENHAGIFGLKQKDGRYVGYTSDAGQRVKLAGKWLGNEKLSLVPNGPTTYGIRNEKGNFLASNGDHVTWSNNLGVNETWAFVPYGQASINASLNQGFSSYNQSGMTNQDSFGQPVGIVPNLLHKISENMKQSQQQQQQQQQNPFNNPFQGGFQGGYHH